MSAGCSTPPLAITGIESAAFTLAIAAQSQRHEHFCSRVRPCTVSTEHPASCSASASEIVSSMSPGSSRIFAVTGTERPPASARTKETTRSRSGSRKAP